jgi:hypothetical protein
LKLPGSLGAVWLLRLRCCHAAKPIIEPQVAPR